jgi:hypothetical protein
MRELALKVFKSALDLALCIALTLGFWWVVIKYLPSDWGAIIVLVASVWATSQVVDWLVRRLIPWLHT